jgi:hypothetical protein
MDYRERIRHYAAQLGAPEKWVDEIFADHLPDDWTLVIKLHAFIESACSECLVRKLGDDAETFVRAMVMHGRTGRVPLLRSLGVLDLDAYQFLTAFGTLRNKLVHSVRNVSINLALEFQQSDGPFTQVGRDLYKAAAEHVPVSYMGAERLTGEELWKRIPEVVIWWRALQIVSDFAAQRANHGKTMWEMMAQQHRPGENS